MTTAIALSDQCFYGRSELAWNLFASNVGADAQVGRVDKGSPWPSSAEVELSISVSAPLLDLSGSGLLGRGLSGARDWEAPGILAFRIDGDDGSPKAIAVSQGGEASS